MAAVREPSSGLSSPGPDSDTERGGNGSRPMTAASNGEHHGATPLRHLTPGMGSSKKNKESPSPEDDNDQQPAKKKRHRRTRADLEHDRRMAELYPEYYRHGKNPRPIDPTMKLPQPGDPGFRGSPYQDRVGQLKSDNAQSPPVRMMPYAAALAPDTSRRESASPATPAPAVAPSPSRNGNVDSIHNSPRVAPEKPQSTSISYSANPSPRTMHYDPIRGYTAETPRTNPVSTAPSPHFKMATTTNAPAPEYRASASPAISSLVNPPDSISTSQALQASRPLLVNSNMNNMPMSTTTSTPSRDPSSRAANAEYPVARTTSTPLAELPRAAPVIAPTPAPTTLEVTLDSSMEVDPGPPAMKPQSSRNSISSGPSPANGPSKPKEKREKPPLPPLPGSGSGLLTSAMLGVPGPGQTGSTEEGKAAPVLCIEVKLEKSGHNIINFSRLAEQKYGFNALHPRLAAQKERLARVAAAGAMLENEARARAKGLDPDAMSEDLDGGSEDEKNADSNAEMAGLSGTEKGDEKPKRKKRNFKEDNYDKEDPFVDDSELGLDEQSALATDGFFVYCGPLVEEGRMPTIQGRPDGLNQPAGRGRGRGRGSRGGPGSRGGRVPGVEGSGTGRGGGPGSRGGRGRGGRGGRGRGSANASPAVPREGGAHGSTPAGGSSRSQLADYIRMYNPNEMSTPSKSTTTAPAGFASGGGGNGPNNAITVE